MHICHILADDLGWAQVGWHRQGPAKADVRTPTLDGLVRDGLELDRLYTHKICSPSRSAIQTGRHPIHVNVQNVLPEVVNPKDPVGGYQGIPINMTGIASVLSRGGYHTHLVGKWDCGMATPHHHPRARGYDTWLGYWHHANDYWKQRVGSCDGSSPRDLWRFNATTDGPALELANGESCSQAEQAPRPGERCVFEDALLTDEVVRIIGAHDPASPLFLFWAPHLVHVPLQVPKAYADAFAFIDDPFRRTAHAMANYLDDQVARVVVALRSRGLWEQTLLVFHSDNGGEIMAAGTCGGNNWPLAGGKFSNWEGGIRVPAFVAGGALPPASRGKKLEAVIAAWDMYATYAAIAGVDPHDAAAAAAGLPPIDSVDQWPLLSGSNSTPPRTELIIGDSSALEPNGDGQTLVGGLIDARAGYKLLLGAADKLRTVSQYTHTGPSWPNTSSHLVPLLHPKVCGRHPSNGCLFDVMNDPTESHNLALAQPARFAALLRRIDEAQRGVYSPVRGTHADPRACLAVEARGGYWGPFVPGD